MQNTVCTQIVDALARHGHAHDIATLTQDYFYRSLTEGVGLRDQKCAQSLFLKISMSIFFFFSFFFHHQSSIKANTIISSI